MASLEGAPIRLGRILYSNVWPVFHYFPEQQFAGRVDIATQVPSGLNKAMKNGTIDLGPMSSFAYGENAEHYMLMPDLSVSANGPVHSILLFHQKPLEQIVDGTIALPTTSATSVNLLKILLQTYGGGKPQYFDAEPDLPSMMARADAALLIGDDAIRASWSDSGYHVTDLGELWKEATGEWMTFAVWGVRRQAVREQEALITELHQAFLESKRKGRQDVTPIIQAAVERIGGRPSYWQMYFDKLSHDFGLEQQRGLQRYFDEAWALGLLSHRVQMELWNTTTSRVNK
ncbi:menaquinone biosynthesis protein [Paenibacillus sp. y28]|uniref:menaquinone biosynthesis protein n=1 Tax=Paenibacillus sp. y28 TaxID=3129110 RepID=UPI00301B2603